MLGYDVHVKFHKAMQKQQKTKRNNQLTGKRATAGNYRVHRTGDI